MGTWGVDITKDDTVLDVIGFVTDRLKAGDSLRDASEKAKTYFSQLEQDEDEGPLIWLALAQVQWKYGSVDQAILERIRNDIAMGHGLTPWQEDEKLFHKRKTALSKFLSRIESPNPKPAKIPKLIVRRAPFKQGDCLVVALPEGLYTAALVLKADNSNLEYGKNLIASLDYLSSIPPSLQVFKRKEWLILSHGNWNNRRDISWYLPVQFKKESARFNVVGNINLGWFTPSDSDMYSNWSNLGQPILQVYAHKSKNA